MVALEILESSGRDVTHGQNPCAEVKRDRASQGFCGEERKASANDKSRSEIYEQTKSWYCLLLTFVLLGSIFFVCLFHIIFFLINGFENSIFCLICR